MPEQIGFAGMGIMGRGMAANLLKAGYALRVWNRTPERARDVLQAGAGWAASPAELAAQADVFMLCVSDTPDVEAVLFGPGGASQGLRPGSLVIDLSTISPDATRRFSARLAEYGVAMLDAPVSGGSEGAQKGTLSIMTGGSEADFERALPILQAVGRTITHVGPIGSGQMVKLVNQILVVGNALAMSEALLFAQAGGLDLQKTLAAVSGGAAGSWMLSNRGPQILARDWRPGFTIDLQNKDVGLVLQEADHLGLPLLMTSQIYQLYRQLQHDGLGAEGNHALIKALEKLSGHTVEG